MYINSKCPCCGVYTTAYLNTIEYKKYLIFGELPNDFNERSVCCCCIDNGFVYKESEISDKKKLFTV